VKWWTGLTECPGHVLEFLEFLIGRVPNVKKAFTLIDGIGGGGSLTLRELENGIDDLGCQKFEGSGKKQAIGAIFRYLDPGGEGSISLDEWMVLDQLWKELELSIREFVQFMCMMFGEDLEECWDALDEDCSGEMDLGEWLDAVDRIGYFGPARIVFSLLDNSDDGNISIDEFMVLEKYKKKAATPPPHRPSIAQARLSQVFAATKAMKLH